MDNIRLECSDGALNNADLFSRMSHSMSRRQTPCQIGVPSFKQVDVMSIREQFDLLVDILVFSPGQSIEAMGDHYSHAIPSFKKKYRLNLDRGSNEQSGVG